MILDEEWIKLVCYIHQVIIFGKQGKVTLILKILVGVHHKDHLIIIVFSSPSLQQGAEVLDHYLLGFGFTTPLRFRLLTCCLQDVRGPAWFGFA